MSRRSSDPALMMLPGSAEVLPIEDVLGKEDVLAVGVDETIKALDSAIREVDKAIKTAAQLTADTSKALNEAHAQERQALLKEFEKRETTKALVAALKAVGLQGTFESDMGELSPTGTIEVSYALRVANNQPAVQLPAVMQKCSTAYLSADRRYNEAQALQSDLFARKVELSRLRQDETGIERTMRAALARQNLSRTEAGKRVLTALAVSDKVAAALAGATADMARLTKK